MVIIAGLGNPGKKYENTWHNIGFKVLDGFQKKNNFSDFRIKKKFNAQISEGVLNDEKIILLKPQTFMNESGKAIKSFIFNFKLKIADLIVVHDDIDLALGRIKISVGRGSAGHKGIESIIRELKTNDFMRLRIGIEPEDQTKKAMTVVLKKIGKKEENALQDAVQNVCIAIETLISEGTEKTMQKFNK